MTVPCLRLKAVNCMIRPLISCYCAQSVNLSLDLCRRNFSRLLWYARKANLHPNTLVVYSTRLKCSKPNNFQTYDNSLRTGLKWGKCASTRIFTKSHLRRGQRCRTVQSVDHLTSGKLGAPSLIETKKKVTKKMKKLKENVLTIPNALCVARIAATPFLGYLVIQEFYTASLGLFILAGVTDVADGYIARTFPSQQSMIGSFLDPAADKLLVATLFLTLTVKGLIPVPLTFLIIFRDVCLMSAGFYIRYISLPPPKTLARYFDVSFATARLSPTSISKANTLIQLSLVAFSLAAPVFGYVDHLFLQVLWYVTGATTVLSAGSYLYYKNTYNLSLPKKRTKKGVAKES